MKWKFHLKFKGKLVLRSVTHTKQRPKHAQTAGELGVTKGTATSQSPKDRKRDENAINWLACHHHKYTKPVSDAGPCSHDRPRPSRASQTAGGPPRAPPRRPDHPRACEPAGDQFRPISILATPRRNPRYAPRCRAAAPPRRRTATPRHAAEPPRQSPRNRHAAAPPRCRATVLPSQAELSRAGTARRRAEPS